MDGHRRDTAAAGRLWLIVGTVCIGAFMGQVDASITQLVLPDVEQSFGASVRAVSWISLVYLLVVAAMLPVFGRLGDMIGRKRLYCVGFGVFVAGSALCGLAPTLSTLIGARVIQGLGAALLQANSVAIIVSAAGAARRGRALGVQSSAQAIGLSAGPAIGGALIVALGWRWVFWINVPVGLIAIALALVALPPEPRARHERFDLTGAVLLVPALALLMFALNETGRAPVGLFYVVLPALAGIALVAWFVAHERKTAAPLLDLALFRSLQFGAGSLGALLSYAILFGVFFVLPFILERAYGESALGAGLRLAVTPVALGLVAPLSGGIADRLGVRAITVAGMLVVLAALAILWAALDGASSGLWLLTVALAVLGVGLGVFTAPNNSAIMAAAPGTESGQAGGLLNVMRSLGMTVGIAVASAILTAALPAAAGQEPATVGAAVSDLLAGARLVVTVLAAFAVVAALVSLVRPRADNR